MKKKDALFNWLQISLVAQARPQDKSAKETVLFFETILREDHSVTNLVRKDQEEEYLLSYELNGEKEEQVFYKEDAKKLLTDILMEPKYN